jgi:hypothetical protein
MPATPRTIEILPPLRARADELADLEWLVDLMDSRFEIPGTKIRFGLDAILGLVPGIGDGVSALVSAFIFQQLTPLTRATCSTLNCGGALSLMTLIDVESSRAASLVRKVRLWRKADMDDRTEWMMPGYS